MRNINLRKLPSIAPAPEVSPFVIRDLEKTIDPFNHLPGRHTCLCDLCRAGKFHDQHKKDSNIFHTSGRETTKWLKKILDGLTLGGAKTMKLFLPDIFFVEADTLEIYHTSRKDNRINKIPGTTPLKTVYPTFVRMRKEYKTILQQKFNETMMDKIDPDFMHIKYFDKLVPSYFQEGIQSKFLDVNKHQFRKYVLHKNSKYEIQQIEEHKMNQKEPFCIVKYSDGNCQLFNQTQFEIYALGSLTKLTEEVSYFQSYIKYKLESDSIHFSTYTFGPTTIDQRLDKKAEQQILVLIGGMNKYDDDYKDIETYDEISFDLMMNNPKQYVDLTTYKLVHYLAMASRIYVNHIKIKWIANDLGSIYLQEVMELEITELPKRFIRFKLTPKDQTPDFYNANNNFVDIYKDMKRRKAINTLIIKRDIDNKTYEEVLEMIDPEAKKQEFKREKSKTKSYKLSLPARPRLDISSQLSKTIDVSQSKQVASTQLQTIQPKKNRYSNFSTYEQHLRQHPEIVMKNRRVDSNSLDRWPISLKPEQSGRVDNQINNHFLFKMTNQDRQIFEAPSKKSGQSPLSQRLDSYLQKQRDRVSQSLLFNTFNNLNQARQKELSVKLNREKIFGKSQNSLPRDIV